MIEKFVDNESESILLGAIINGFRFEQFEEISGVLTIDHFYSPENKYLFSIMSELYNSAGSFDHVSILNRAKELDLTNIVTASYLTSLNIYYHKDLTPLVDIIQKNFKRREVYKSLCCAIDMCSDLSVNVDEILSYTERSFINIENSNSAGSYRNIQEILSEEMDKIKEKRKSPGFISGVSSGYNLVDDKTNGFSGGQMIVIAARAGIGKTAFAVDLARNMCMNDKKSVGFISLEMPSSEISMRLVSSYTCINSKKFKKPYLLTKEEIFKLGTMADEVKQVKFFIQDRAGMTMADIRSEARCMKRKDAIDALFIDYLGLIKPDSQSIKMPRWERMQEISSQIKTLAKELNIPIFVLNQLNRDAEGKKPTLANLRETGAIEQDADMVFILHRERNPKEGERGILTTLMLEKNRNGVSGDTDLLFIPEYASFKELDYQYKN